NVNSRIAIDNSACVANAAPFLATTRQGGAADSNRVASPRADNWSLLRWWHGQAAPRLTPVQKNSPLDDESSGVTTTPKQPNYFLRRINRPDSKPNAPNESTVGSGT